MPAFELKWYLLDINMVSPIDADIVMDVRFLPNPHYIAELRPLTGLEEPVYDYVMSFSSTENFYQRFLSLLQSILPGYVEEGKSNLLVAIWLQGTSTVQSH